MTETASSGRAMRRSLVFSGVRQTTLVSEPIPTPQATQVLIRTIASGISAGTERLVFEGRIDHGTALDTSIASLNQDFDYPVRYGYALVGEVQQIGVAVEQSWLGRRVFAFHPHASHALVDVSDAQLVPDEVDSDLATLIPTVETALNFTLDAAPLVGERVVVVGQGVVGLVLTALLARHPLETVWAVEPDPFRRELSRQLGADEAVAPSDVIIEGQPIEEFQRVFGSPRADLVFEVSSNASGLELAVQLAGEESRIIVGSWFGDAALTLKLGTHFHRSRIRIISSQVSSLAPRLRGRWNQRRRLDQAMRLLPTLAVERLVTHRFEITEARRAYELIAESTLGERLGHVVLTYD